VRSAGNEDNSNFRKKSRKKGRKIGEFPLENVGVPSREEKERV